jgi:adenosylcobyric acid synthase
MKALMVQGTSSWSGKSLLSTALARLIARRGISVAPFKAQNMSNNARVVDGGEIGAAQWLQARAAGAIPDVRMNPVLVKPEADNRSQVVVMGRPDLSLSRRAWHDRPPHLWPVIQRAFASLQAEYEMLVIEGAGSPAEINLRATDLANMRTAELADARVLLVADIERGGAFAHLYGTWGLLGPAERSRIAGFVLNKFRGDRNLLEPGPQQLKERTGIGVRAVIPRLAHGIPDEDGAARPGHVPDRVTVAVIRYPAASNLDEFKALEQVANVVWVHAPHQLLGAALIVLPGSKHVAADLSWLRGRGLDTALGRLPTPVLGICGGMQMLGRQIEDPDRIEGAATGMGLLPLVTRLALDKTARSTHARFGNLPQPWASLCGLEVSGYEIRHGHSQPLDGAVAALDADLGFVNGRFLGVYLHGLFEQPHFVTALLGSGPDRSLQDELDRLADAVAEHLDIDQLLEELQ